MKQHKCKFVTIVQDPICGFDGSIDVCLGCGEIAINDDIEWVPWEKC